ncbi:NaeI family type II restriction endonuclease [Kineococcus indalonis]|uniref:NaeI family type II restriction endonuclease n=1 Tax=Kineococcus indalonis TaxID=2696566 RepID=UPI00141282FA|nr:NaeI family type II restriction endonuclease [Kineococcus indalonis]NAZ85197.1 hypothetical protein [Kineococcus indalonis]
MSDDALPPNVEPREIERKRGGRGRAVVPPGHVCTSDRGVQHIIESPDQDSDFQRIADWITSHIDVNELIGDAIEDAIYYVLDGWRTHRFDLLDDRVDSDERRALGTKLQYHVLENFNLPKLKHPDTEVCGIGLEIKGTVRDNWSIPKEGQCGITLLIRVDVERGLHRSWLMRTHRAWLRNAPNNDGKRGVAAVALAQYAQPIYEWTSLRPNPLKMLSSEQSAMVFSDAGQEVRLDALFHALPRVVIQRAVILTVCANRADPLRRVRATRPRAAARGYALLCGKWVAQRKLASILGHDLTGAAWVAVQKEQLAGHAELTTQVLKELKQDGF